MLPLNRHDFEPGCPYFRERNKGAHEIKLFRVYQFFEE